MFCTNCGNKIKDNEDFCTECGMSIINKKNNHKNTEAETVSTPKKENEEQIKAGGTLLKKIKLSKREWFIIGIMGIIVIILFLIYGFEPTKKISADVKSVVNIWCDNEGGGSGTLFTNDGLILTNNHVIEGSTYCLITIPNPETGKTEEIYKALPTITPVLSKKYDVATLKISDIFIDEEGEAWGTFPLNLSPFVLPKTCDTNKASKLGDSVRIYGYPVTSGGFNLTITDGIISSFTDEGEILTSAQIDSGNSGGLAIDQDGCWLGIPSAVVSGDYQNLGVIIPGSVVEYFIETAPAKLNPIADNIDYTKESIYSPEEEDDDSVCQRGFGKYSEWSGEYNDEGNPTCTCQTGYSWDASGDYCALGTSLLKECRDKYGYGSYSTTENGKAVCDCSSGYVWNLAQTACVVEQEPVLSNDQICANDYVNSHWSETNDGCDCNTGYYWDINENGDGGGCYTKEALNQSCNKSFSNSKWDGTYSETDGVFICGCKSGYEWNTARTACN